MFNKSMLGATALVAVLALSSGHVMAKSTDVKTSGSVNLTNINVTNDMVTPFTTVNVGGGVWDYGTSWYSLTQKKVWSNYYHGSLTHSATCSIGTRSNSSNKIAAGQTAFSSAIGGLNEPTHANWNTY